MTKRPDEDYGAYVSRLKSHAMCMPGGLTRGTCSLSCAILLTRRPRPIDPVAWARRHESEHPTRRTTARRGHAGGNQQVHRCRPTTIEETAHGPSVACQRLWQATRKSPSIGHAWPRGNAKRAGKGPICDYPRSFATTPQRRHVLSPGRAHRASPRHQLLGSGRLRRLVSDSTSHTL